MENFYTVGYAYRQHYAVKDDKTGKVQTGDTLRAVVHKHDAATGDIIRTVDCKCNPALRDTLIENIKKHAEFSLCYYDEYGRLCGFVSRGK